MISKALVQRLFEAFSIRRWNDQIHPVDLMEMDKHGHKMAIVYCLARWEESLGGEVDWNNLIRGGLYELLRRVVLSDIKSPVYRRIRTDHPEVFARLNDWVFEQLRPHLPDEEIRSEFHDYLHQDDFLDPLSRRLLAAGHVFASFWEFQIIRHSSLPSSQMAELDSLMHADLEPHQEIPGVRKLLRQHPTSRFVDLVGQLRFQVRWSQTPRIPHTSVLGHSMMVAVLTYLLSREVGGCPARLRNNFFGGLFHDLPESVTRDIISPVKGADPALGEVIGEIERDLVDQEIYPLLDKEWHEEFRYLIEDEFSSRIREGGVVRKTTSDEINARYNDDEYSPYDGEIVKVCDHLAAFAEAFISCETGIRTRHLEDGMKNLQDIYKSKEVAGIDIGAIYSDF